MLSAKSKFVAIVLFIFSAAIPALPAEQNEHVLKNVPADVLFCARVKNLEYSASMVDQFLVGVSPVPFATAMLVRMQLAQFLGNPELQGVNMAGSFAVFATAEPNKIIPDFCALIPITDYSRIADVNTNVPKPDPNGISAIVLNGKPFGCITKLDSYALLSTDYAGTLRMKKSLSAANTTSLFAALGPDEVKQADSDLIWAYGNIGIASKKYGPMLFDKLEQFKKMMQKTNDPNSPASPMDPAFMIDGYSRMLKMLLNDGQSLIIAASPKPDLLLIKTSLKARSGTEMAGILTADSAPRQKNNLTGYLRDGAVMNLTSSINHNCMKKLNQMGIEWISLALRRDTNAPDIIKFKNISAQVIDSLGTLYACTFSADPNNKPPFVVEYFLEVKDPEKFNNAADEFVKAWPGSTCDNFYKKMGAKTAFTIKRGVDNYKGIPIDVVTFNMDWLDANSPQSQMLNSMYGPEMNFRMAIVNGLWVCKNSSDPNDMHKLIDQIKAGPSAAPCSEMQKAVSLIPDADSKDFIATYNYLRVFKMMKAFMPVPMPIMDVPSKSNLVFAAKVRDGTVTVDIAVPKEHLAEIMSMFQMMMQQNTQQKPMMAPSPVAP